MSFMDIPVDFGGTTIMTQVAVGDGMAPLSNGNIGHFFIRNFIASFDWSTSIMYLDDVSEGGSLEPMPSPSAAGIAWAGGKVVVASVPAGGPAARAGLTAGEVVTHMDGESIEGWGLDQICEHATSRERHLALTTVGGKTYPTPEMDGFFARPSDD